MSIGDRLNALSNRFFDTVRHPQTKAAAAEPGTARDLDGFAGRKYALLTTFRKDGTPMPTPVWFGVADGAMYVRSEANAWKVKRVRRDPHVRVAPATVRGKPLGPAAEATARILEESDAERAEAALQANYGLGRRLYEGGADRLDAEVVYLEIVPATPGAP